MSDQCARAPDGSLLDASEIDFYPDPDSTVPISGPSLLSTDAGRPTHPFFKHHEPAQVVAGARRTSGRASRPSSRLLDPNNAERLAAAPPKRKQATATTGERGAKRQNKQTVLSESEGESNGEAMEVDPEVVPSLEDDGVPPSDTEGSQSDGAFSVVDTDADDDALADAGYAFTKALGDSDRQAMISRPKSDKTADVRTIFKSGERINRETGKSIKGSWCRVCQKAKVSEKNCFLTGSVTSLRNHIARHRDHISVYKEECERLGIPMNERVVSGNDDDGVKQTNLDGIVSREPRPPPFTFDGLMDHLIEMIVAEDLPFILVERSVFKRTLKYIRPSLTEKDLPNRSQVRAEIVKRAEKAEAKIKECLEKIPSKVSFTFDAWTSDSNDPYLSITGHYINSPADRPTEWELKCEQLAFTPLTGNHSGKNIGSVIVRTIDRYQIRSKVGWFTSDNASNNDTAMTTVAKSLDPKKEAWDPKRHRVRCMEHSVHLAASHFVSSIAPTSATALVRKAKSAIDKASRDGEVDLDLLEDAVRSCGLDDDGDGDDEEDDDDDDGDDPEPGDDDSGTMADALGKILALVKQIRASPQARAYFFTCCRVSGTPPANLITWVRTRWASLHAFLTRVIALKDAINHFVATADRSDEVPNLRNKLYASFTLTRRDWDRLAQIHEVLQEPANATQTFSSSRNPTVYRSIPVLEFLNATLENMAHAPRFLDLATPISAAVKNVRKWYLRLDDTDAYFICLVLDPNVKLAYAESKWSKSDLKAARARLEDVFDKYHSTPESPGGSKSTIEASRSTVKTPAQPSRPAEYSYAWMQTAIQARKEADQLKASPRDELEAYLNSKLEETSNVLTWWGQRTSQYPTLSRMARDYLAIQGSATPSERAFSSAKLTGSSLRNRLTPQIFESIQILKAAYRNGHASATEEAHSSLQAQLEELHRTNDES